MRPNLLDRTLGYFAPGLAAERLRQRARIDLLSRRGYDAADLGRRTGGWITPNTDAQGEIGPAIAKLRARSRDLVRNDPVAANAMTKFASNAVSTGLLPRCYPTKDDAKLAERVDSVWWEHSQVIDATGVCDFAGLEVIVTRTVAESGSAIIRRRSRRLSDGLPVPFQIEVLDPDYLDTSRDNPSLPNGGWIIGGIEYDPLGAKKSFWLFKEHPGSPMFNARQRESSPVPAYDCILVFDPLRAGQFGGVPWLAPVILRMRDLNLYSEAENVRKQIEACMVAFVFGDPEADAIGSVPGVDPSTGFARAPAEMFSPGQINYVGKEGKDVKFAEPKASGDYVPHMKWELHLIAAGFGLTYEILSGDMSEVNFSSYRAGLNQFHRRVRQFQKNSLIFQFGNGVWRWFIEAGIATGQWAPQRLDAEWHFPEWETVQPVDDAAADLAHLQMGGMSWGQYCSKRGLDPVDQIRELSRWKAELAKADLNLTGTSPAVEPAPADDNADAGKPGDDGGKRTATGQLLRLLGQRSESAREAI